MICPNCKKENSNKYETECIFCHTALYNDEKQIKKIHNKKRLSSIGKFFAIAVPSVLLWCVVIYVFFNAPNISLFQKDATNIETTLLSDSTYNESNNDSTYNESNGDSPQINNSIIDAAITAPQPTVATAPVTAPLAETTLPPSQDEFTQAYIEENNVETTFAYSFDSSANHSSSHGSSTSNKPNSSKPNTNSSNTASYNEEIKQENQKHQDNLNQINTDYDFDIKYCQEDINYYRSICGYQPSSSYPQRISSLQNEISQKQQKLYFMMSDTSNSHAANISALQRELEYDYEELTNLQVNYDMALQAEQYEQQLANLKTQKNNAILTENARHDQAIKNINSKYGK